MISASARSVGRSSPCRPASQAASSWSSSVLHPLHGAGSTLPTTVGLRHAGLPKGHKYSEIIADYNREKDRVTIEETFAQLVAFAAGLSAEQQRATEEGLTEDELAVFDLLKKENLSKADRERVKLVSKDLLAAVRRLVAPLERWTAKEQTQAEVEVFILDRIYESLPTPPFDDEEKQKIARLAYQHIWQQSAGGGFSMGANA